MYEEELINKENQFANIAMFDSFTQHSVCDINTFEFTIIDQTDSSQKFY